jgi:hypothetical protein
VSAADTLIMDAGRKLSTIARHRSRPTSLLNFFMQKPPVKLRVYYPKHIKYTAYNIAQAPRKSNDIFSK